MPFSGFWGSAEASRITIALIYKFMDDMDAGSEEIGGLRKFFTGEFAPFRLFETDTKKLNP